MVNVPLFSYKSFSIPAVDQLPYLTSWAQGLRHGKTLPFIQHIKERGRMEGRGPEEVGERGRERERGEGDGKEGGREGRRRWEGGRERGRVREQSRTEREKKMLHNSSFCQVV